MLTSEGEAAAISPLVLPLPRLAQSSTAMNARDFALASISAAVGALAALLAARVASSSSSDDGDGEMPSLPLPDANGTADGTPPQRSPFDPSKRDGYISWDDYFMAIAFLSAQRSKDPNRQVGACLVSQDGIILGIGYNGFPRGCSDNKLPWAKKSKNGNLLETKYPYVVHAEVNAILNTNHASAAGQKLYVTMFPCNECAKIIIQSGVSEVIYYVDKRLGNSDAAYVASHKLLSMAGVKLRYLSMTTGSYLSVISATVNGSAILTLPSTQDEAPAILSRNKDQVRPS